MARHYLKTIFSVLAICISTSPASCRAGSIISLEELQEQFQQMRDNHVRKIITLWAILTTILGVLSTVLVTTNVSSTDKMFLSDGNENLFGSESRQTRGTHETERRAACKIFQF